MAHTVVLTIPNADVFILAGGISPYGLLREMGVQFGGEQKDPQTVRVAPVRTAGYAGCRTVHPEVPPP